MIKTIRTPWAVMGAAISALSIRYIQNKFILGLQSRRAFGFIAVFFEPLTHIFMWMMINQAFAINTHTDLPTPLFILLGALPFLFTRNVLQQSTEIIQKNRKLFNFRQIRPIDPLIAMLLMECLINLTLFFMFLACFYWFDIPTHVKNPSHLFVASLCYVFFLFGIALIITLLGFFLGFVKKLVSILVRLIYLVSGVFFNTNLLPSHLKAIFLTNPLFQYIEMLRTGFSQNQTLHIDTSLLFLFECALFSLLLGLAGYIVMRDRIFIEIEQR